MEKLKKELNIWSQCNNDHLIRLYEITNDPEDDEMYLTTEFAKYGRIAVLDHESCKVLRNKKLYYFILAHIISYDPAVKEYEEFEQIEVVTHYLFDSVIKGLESLHNEGLVHRDLKVENILAV